MKWLLIMIISISLFNGCAGEGEPKGEEQPAPAGSTGTAAKVSGTSNIPEAGEVVWDGGAVSIAKLDNSEANGCHPGIEKPGVIDLGDRIYTSANRTIVQKVYCNADLELTLTDLQARELEVALRGLYVVTVMASGDPSKGCNLAPGIRNTWLIVDEEGPRNFFTSPTSDCADSKVLRGTEAVNPIMERFLRQAGLIQ